MRIVRLLLLVWGASTLLWAQDGDKWEISGLAGGSMYRDLTASGTNPSRSAKAGFFEGIAAGAVLGQTGRQRFGGEFHYLFQTNNMRLKSGAGTSGAADFAAQSHAFHYDVVVYATRRDARIRPFIAGGPGLKLYQASGSERAFQPLGNVVILSRENELKFMVSAGAGVKARLTRNALVRLDFRDYLTGIPKNFTAFPGVRLNGQFHNLVATVGVGIVF